MLTDDEIKLLQLAEYMGYGRALQVIAARWRTEDPQSAHTIGPCSGLMTPCECASSGRGCDWCEGTGIVTRRVSGVILGGEG